MQAIAALASETGYAGVSLRAIRMRARLSHKEVCALFGDSECAFLAAYDEITVGLADSLREAQLTSPTDARVQVASCVNALIEFASGGPEADLWLFAVREGNCTVRERRAAVMAEMAELIFHPRLGGQEYAVPPAHALVALGGILEILAERRRCAQWEAMRQEAHQLVAFAWSALPRAR